MTPAQRYSVTSTVTRTRYESDEGMNTGEFEETSCLSGNDVFNARVRAVLGVTDPRAPVQVEQTEGTANPWGCETFESYESVTITCAGKSRHFESLPDLFRALDKAVPGV